MIIINKTALPLLIILLILTGCNTRTYENEPTLTPTPVPTEMPLPTEVPPTRNFTSVTGVITNVEGPVDKDGSVPWYVDWLRIDIEKDDGTPAVIIGVHQTAYLFGSKPTVGMAVEAFIADDNPTITAEPPMYVSSAIIADMPPDFNFTTSWIESGDDINSYNSSDGTFSFKTDSETIITTANEMLKNRSIPELNNVGAVVVYASETEDIPLASSVVILDNLWDRTPPGEVALSFMDYIFPASDFEKIDLPIFVNDDEIEALPPMLAADGSTVLVPFRQIFMSGIGFGDYAYLTFDGQLDFGGGGGGSENSYWMVGSTIVKHMGWVSHLNIPPIIVNGVIYVPLLSSFAYAAPYSGAWLFDDKIDIYSPNTYPYGTWFGRYTWEDEESFISKEEVAAMSIVVNGIELDIPPAVLAEYDDLMVPITPIAEALGYRVRKQDEKTLFISKDSSENETQWNCELINDESYVNLEFFPHSLKAHFIIYEDQILINAF